MDAPWFCPTLRIDAVRFLADVTHQYSKLAVFAKARCHFSVVNEKAYEERLNGQYDVA